MASKSWVVDVSHWQGSINGPLLASKNVDSVIIKLDQDYAKHAREVRKTGMKLGAYWWSDPIPAYTVEKQMADLKRIAEVVPPDFYALDVEQWWDNWGTWGQARRKQIAWTAVRLLASKRISDVAFQQYNLLKEIAPTLVYTSQGFVKSYAPDMAKWLPGVPMWLAWYPYWKFVPGTWETTREYVNTYYPNTIPLLPAGVAKEDVALWQFSGDKLVLPGTYKDPAGKYESPIDLSIMMWEQSKWDAFLGKVSESQPSPLTDKEKLDTLWNEHHPEGS